MNFAFQFFVGKHMGLREHFDTRTIPMAGFFQFDDAREFALNKHDRLNWILIYDTSGKVVKAFSPNL